jgi:hypothetical protein
MGIIEIILSCLVAIAVASNVVVVISLLRQNKKLTQLVLIDQERRAMSILHPDKLESPSYQDVDYDLDFSVNGRASRTND